MLKKGANNTMEQGKCENDDILRRLNIGENWILNSIVITKWNTLAMYLKYVCPFSGLERTAMVSVVPGRRALFLEWGVVPGMRALLLEATGHYRRIGHKWAWGRGSATKWVSWAGDRDENDYMYLALLSSALEIGVDSNAHQHLAISDSMYQLVCIN